MKCSPATAAALGISTVADSPTRTRLTASLLTLRGRLIQPVADPVPTRSPCTTRPNRSKCRRLVRAWGQGDTDR